MRVATRAVGVLGIFLFGFFTYLWQDTRIAGAEIALLTASEWSYLPLIQREVDQSPTPLPTATSTSVNTEDVRITKIFFDGTVVQYESDEYVEIRNFDTRPIKLQGWKLLDEGPNHTYTFPNYTMLPGETCRIYTNQNHSEWCGLSWGDGNAIWNNDGDTATLKDGNGRTISSCSYSGSGPTKTCT